MDIVEPKQKEATIAALAIKADSDSSNIASVQTCEVRRLRHLHGRAETSAEVTGEVEQDSVAVEMPVALVFNGISHAVMMLTPNDLEDFAVGFSLTEGIIDKAEQIYDCEVEANQHEGTVGVSIHITLASEKFAALKEKRRFMTGRTGCGLCGTESLTQAIRQPAPVTHAQSFSAAAVSKAVASMKTKQSLLEFTGATHTVFLSYAGRTYSARYYNDGTLAGLGRATTATSHDVPTTYLSQLPSWHGSSQFRRSLRRWLTAQPA